MGTAIIAQTQLAPRYGPKPLVVAGMVLAAGGMLLLAGLSIHSTYIAGVLPSLLLIGLGYGLIVAPATSTATLGVRAADAGVASATVSASQQIGGSIGTALLSTIAASAVTSSLAGARPTAALIATASVHGYTTAFTLAAGIFATGGLMALGLFRPGVPTVKSSAAVAAAH